MSVLSLELLSLKDNEHGPDSELANIIVIISGISRGLTGLMSTPGPWLPPSCPASPGRPTPGTSTSTRRTRSTSPTP